MKIAPRHCSCCPLQLHLLMGCFRVQEFPGEQDFSWCFSSEPNAQHIPFVVSRWAGDSKPLDSFPVQKKSPWKYLLILYILSCLLNSHSSLGAVIPTDGKSSILEGVIAFSTADRTGPCFRWSSIPFFVTQVICSYFNFFGFVLLLLFKEVNTV